jgi:hypothetical protein
MNISAPKMSNESQNQPPLAYATPGAPTGSPTAAAAVLAFIGLGLIVLGGCFLIPLASPLFDPKNASPPSAYISTATIVLLLIACTCFGFAAWLLFIAVKRLLRVMRG